MAEKVMRHGLPRMRNAFRYSWQGCRAAWKHETAFREELIVVAVLCPLAFWVGSSPLQIAFLIGVSLQVLLVELLNSAVEAVVDRTGEEIHELSGRAKDMGSAAVLVSITIALSSWLILLWAKFA